MEVRFTKGKGGRTCGWVAVRPPRSRVPGPTMAAGGDLPHDLATFVIEQALGIEHGFWGCVADGATFRSLGRRRTEPGKAVIREHRDELDDAERRVNAASFAWRRGEPTEVDDAIEAMLAAWRAVPVGGDLVLEWVPAPRSRDRPRRARAGRGSRSRR